MAYTSMNGIEIEDVLARDAFRTLMPAELQALREFGHERDMAVGDFLMESGKDPENVYVLLSGRVDIHDPRDPENHRDGSVRQVATTTVFLMIGAAPFTEWLGGQVELDGNGFIRTGQSDAGQSISRFQTSMPGVYAIGDVRAESVKRVASAVGERAVVIADVHRYLA